ncbi:unnamed protein product, partial [Effrenium voratum]
MLVFLLLGFVQPSLQILPTSEQKPILLGCFTHEEFQILATGTRIERTLWEEDIYDAALRKSVKEEKNVFAVAMFERGDGFIATASSFAFLAEKPSCTEYSTCPGGERCGCANSWSGQNPKCYTDTWQENYRWAIYSRRNSSLAVSSRRTTTNGCLCESRSTCNGEACCNEDQDPNGDWCFVVSESCEGRSFGYCAPAESEALAFLVEASGGDCTASILAGTPAERTFTKRGISKAGAPYFTNTPGDLVMYYEPDCTQNGSVPALWIVHAGNISQFDMQRVNDLAQDGSRCAGEAYVEASSWKGPPPSSYWTLSCPDFSSTFLRLAAIPASLNLSGVDCGNGTTFNENLNGRWELAGMSANNDPIYNQSGAARYLYYDPKCDNNNALGMWILTGQEPSFSRLMDLDGDGECRFYAYCMTESSQPPASCNWKMACGTGWTDMSLSISPDTTSASPAATTGSPDPVVQACDLRFAREEAGQCLCQPGFREAEAVRKTKQGYQGSCELAEGACFHELTRSEGSECSASYDATISDLSDIDFCAGIAAGASIAASLSAEVCAPSQGAGPNKTVSFIIPSSDGATLVGCALGRQAMVAVGYKNVAVPLLSYSKVSYAMFTAGCPNVTCSASPAEAARAWRAGVPPCDLENCGSAVS